MKKRLTILIIFFISFLIVSNLRVIDGDGIFSYGFSYNISKGLIPYHDFNMVIGPIYSIMFSFLIKAFGNYYFLFKIEHYILYSFIFMFIYEKMGLKSIFVFFLFCTLDTLFGYNAFVLILFLAILLLQDSDIKKKNIIIGILLGIIIMTKQNIGFCLAISYIIINRKNIKECFSILISIVPIIIYLIITNSLKDYIDFCYLGLGKFFDNLYVDTNAIIGYLIFLIPLTYIIIKNKKIKPEIIYIIAFQVVSIPIFDRGHIFVGTIPMLYYILLENDNRIINYYIKGFTTSFFLIYLVLSLIGTKTVMENNYLKYQRIYKETPEYLKQFSKYIDENRDYKIYLLMENAYLIKLYRNKTLSFYDIINEGNMGKRDNYYLSKMKEDCNNKKCMFILDSKFYKKAYYQGLRNFKDYVEQNSKYLETLPSGDRVYINYK